MKVCLAQNDQPLHPMKEIIMKLQISPPQEQLVSGLEICIINTVSVVVMK